MQDAMAPVIEVDAFAVTAFVGYLIVIMAIGVYAARYSSAGLSEFFVGGRRMHRFVVALSAVVSGRSAWLLLAVTGMAYVMGASALWAVVGYTVAEAFLFVFYAPRLRRFSGAYDCITLPDFFARRFDDARGTLRMALAAVLLVFMVAYVSSQFVGGGKAIATSFALDPTTGILLTAGFVLAYTVLGGFLAVSLTDTVQGVLMLVALTGLPLIAAANFGGLDAVFAELSAFDPTMLSPTALGLGVFIAFVGIGLGSPGNPHILVRYISIRDPNQLRFAAVVGTLWNVLMGAGAVFIGLIGRAYFPDVGMLPASDAENVFPYLAQQQLHPLLFGIVIAAVFAAIMSTADSQLLVATSSLVRDVYEKAFLGGSALEQRTLVLYSRVVIVVLVGAALLLGTIAEQLVFWLVLLAWAGLGAAIGPTSILALYWRRTTRAGVFAGMLVGACTSVVWYFTPVLKDRMYELVPAFTLGLITTVVVSLLTRPPADVPDMFRVMAGEGAVEPEASRR